MKYASHLLLLAGVGMLAFGLYSIFVPVTNGLDHLKIRCRLPDQILPLQPQPGAIEIENNNRYPVRVIGLSMC